MPPDAATPQAREAATYARRMAATVLFLARIQLRKRYTGSWLGLGWSLVHPVVHIVTLYFAFKIVMRVPIANYGIYLAAGLLPWGFLTGVLLTASNSLISRRGALFGSVLPHPVHVAADATVELFGFLIAFGLLVLFTLYAQTPGAAALATLPVALVPLVVTAYSGAVIVAYLTIRLRDLRHLLRIGLNLMMWMIPVVYHWSLVPPRLAPFVQYNPFAILLAPFQVVLHAGEVPSLRVLLAGYVIAACSAGVAWLVHRRLAPTAIYHI